MVDTFKKWLEAEEQDFDYYRDIILNFLNLDPAKGLSLSLDAINKNNLKQKLQGLGEFARLPVEIQQQVMGRIDQGGGTIGDLVRLMASQPQDIEASDV